jgi:hypothetical protein
MDRLNEEFELYKGKIEDSELHDLIFDLYRETVYKNQVASGNTELPFWSHEMVCTHLTWHIYDELGIYIKAIRMLNVYQTELGNLGMRQKADGTLVADETHVKLLHSTIKLLSECITKSHALNQK